jgi:hypothetical protein
MIDKLQDNLWNFNKNKEIYCNKEKINKNKMH